MLAVDFMGENAVYHIGVIVTVEEKLQLNSWNVLFSVNDPTQFTLPGDTETL
jgi:hypothetical protein